MKKNLLLTALMCILMVTGAYSQLIPDYQKNIKSTAEEYAEGFLQPLVDVISADLNSGWYHNAVAPKLGIQLYVGVKPMVGFIPDDAKTFNIDGVNQNIPTIFGSSTAVNGVRGVDQNFLPLFVPQVKIGSVFGTNLTARYIKLNIKGQPIEVSGWGIKHNVSQWIPNFVPLDLAAGFYINNFKFTDYLIGNTGIVNLQASYTKLLVTIYGGVGYEFSNVDAKYDYQLDENTVESVSINMNGQNQMRLTAGVTLNLGPLKFNADYNLGYQSVISAGFGFAFNDK